MIRRNGTVIISWLLTAQVPDTPKTREHFGVLGRNRGHACVGMSILYDVENTWVINPVFTGCAMDERGEACIRTEHRRFDCFAER